MGTDRKPLIESEIDRVALRVEEGTATPKEATELIAEFVRQEHHGQIEPRLVFHVARCFAAFLAGERQRSPTIQTHYSADWVPINSLDKAFGLVRPRRGQPRVDPEARITVAVEVLRKMVAGDTLEVASEAVAADRRKNGLPISSETDVREAWADHKGDALMLIRPEVSPSGAPWTNEEIKRLTEIDKDLAEVIHQLIPKLP